jgi:hypothetical protein
MYLLDVFRMSGLFRLSTGGVDALGHSALRELAVLPTGPEPGLWVWTVIGLIVCVGFLGWHMTTGRRRPSGNRHDSRIDRLRSSRSVGRAKIQ